MDDQPESSSPGVGIRNKISLGRRAMRIQVQIGLQVTCTSQYVYMSDMIKCSHIQLREYTLRPLSEAFIIEASPPTQTCMCLCISADNIHNMLPQCAATGLTQHGADRLQHKLRRHGVRVLAVPRVDEVHGDVIVLRSQRRSDWLKYVEDDR